jgi:hypothetical protein
MHSFRIVVDLIHATLHNFLLVEDWSQILLGAALAASALAVLMHLLDTSDKVCEMNAISLRAAHWCLAIGIQL